LEPPTNCVCASVTETELHLEGELYFCSFQFLVDLYILHIVSRFWVDSTPIRVFKNNEAAGIAFPNSQPMRIFSTIYDADSWATDGGRVKIDWSQSPFVASYQSFEISACNVSSHSSPSCTNNWWDQTEFQSLNQYQLGRLQWVRKNYLIYDYCGDRARYATPPPECSLNP